MTTGGSRVEHVDVRIHGRCLVREPTNSVGRPDVLLGFHGFAENASLQMRELERIPALEGWRLVAVEALHPFYRRSGEIVASWMTSQDRELAIEENLRYVRSVLDRVAPPGSIHRLAVLGFSQGTAMAYRTAAYAGRGADGVVALGGDVPPELGSLDELPFRRVLIARGRDEIWYGEEKLAADRELLAGVGLEPQVFEFDGGHEWTDAFRERASRFLAGLAPERVPAPRS